MAHDVFISHSSQDKPVADAVCAVLENATIRCWIAPRDVQPGRSFAGEINRGIHHSKVMVLIFSAHSNASEQVLREVQLAANSHLHIVQFRIQDVLPNDDLEYYLSAPHWLDALAPPLENHLERLKDSVNALLQLGAAEPPKSTAAVTVDSTAERSSQGAVAPKVEERAPPVPPGVTPAKSSQRNFWMPALVAAVVLCGILLGVILLRQRERPKSEARPQKPATPIATVGKLPANPPVNRGKTSQPYPTPSAKGARLFSHNFETASPIVRPIFGPNVMSVLNANGEGQITGKSPGILPAMFDKFLLDDFILECGMRAETVPPGACYGFIFRAAAVNNGGLNKYYALLLDPNTNVAEISWWMEGRWVTNLKQPVPAGLLQVGRKSRITLEALGNRFRTFVNERFAAEFSIDGLKDGRIGFCLSGADSNPWTVYFDNFQIFLPPGKEPTDATSTAASPAPSANRRKPFQRSWDFSAGMLHDIRSEGVELVDAKIWKMTGGKHVRFLTGGRSWLEATFEIPDGAEAPTRLTVRHLSSSPDGKQPGFSPVRITLNGGEVFRGSPAKSGWTEDQIDLGRYVQPGMNTLRWEYLDGAQTHYWLKSFYVSSGNQ
jgi:TIR domain-containing protein